MTVRVGSAAWRASARRARSDSSACSFAGRRDAHDVVLEHVAEAVLLEDQVERLVPGHVLELDRDRAADLGVDHDVQAGQLGDRAEDVLDVGVLQVERDRLARELGLRLGDRPRAVLVAWPEPTAPGRARPRRLRRALRRGWISARTWPAGPPGRAPEPVRARPAEARRASPRSRPEAAGRKPRPGPSADGRGAGAAATVSTFGSRGRRRLGDGDRGRLRFRLGSGLGLDRRRGEGFLERRRRGGRRLGLSGLLRLRSFRDGRGGSRDRRFVDGRGRRRRRRASATCVWRAQAPRARTGRSRPPRRPRRPGPRASRRRERWRRPRGARGR